MTTLDPIEALSRTKSIDDALLDDWQRDLPLVARPFAAIARSLKLTEGMVIERLGALQERGVVARVGGVVRPNTLGASTLAALAAPALEVDAAAERLAEIPGINHIYLRENAVNLWFVVTGPDRAYVDAVLRTAQHRTGLAVLDLRLEEAYHIDLGFALGRPEQRRNRHGVSAAGAASATCDTLDRALAQVLTDGLPLVEQPFAEVGSRLGLPEDEVIRRIDRMVVAGVVPRVGVIVRHRALGWRSNAMVVWDVAPSKVAAAGAALTEIAGINLCYRRTRYERAWPYNLYCMVHARTRDEALVTIDAARHSAGLADTPMRILFSLRCYKQTGALISTREAA